MNIVTSIESPFTTYHVVAEADGNYSIRTPDGQLAYWHQWGTRDEFGVTPSFATAATFAIAYEMAFDLGYEDHQADEGAKAERAADPHGLFL